MVEFLQNYDNKLKSQTALQKVLDDEAKAFGGGDDNDSGRNTPSTGSSGLYDKSANASPFPDDNSTNPKSMF